MSRKNSVSLNCFDSTEVGVTADMSGDCISRKIEVKGLDNASIHCSWAAGPIGELQILAQNSDSDTWFNINTGTTWAISGSDSEAQIYLASLPFNYIKLKFVRTSGTGTLKAFMTGKSVGA